MSSAAPSVFALVDVRQTFGATRALDGFSLEVPPGQTTVLLGPSGGGKSTALRTMLGLALPEAGEVRFLGERLTPASARTLRRRMGYGVQGGGLFPHLTAQDNIALPARVARWEPARIVARVEALRALTHLGADALARYPAQLSGGQTQRVALMRALMLEPEVLLLDEPLGALDPDTRFELQGELKRIFATLKKTVVLVTHDLPEAYFLGDRWAILEEGKVAQTGAPDDILARPISAFVARFLGAQRAMPEVGRLPEAATGVA